MKKNLPRACCYVLVLGCVAMATFFSCVHQTMGTIVFILFAFAVTLLAPGIQTECSEGRYRRMHQQKTEKQDSSKRK